MTSKHYICHAIPGASCVARWVFMMSKASRKQVLTQAWHASLGWHWPYRTDSGKTFHVHL